MTRCAREGCTGERIVGNQGSESYCRQHKNEIARLVRHAGKDPEVLTTVTCQHVSCENTFEVSSWGLLRKYCSDTCARDAPKAARAVARTARQAARSRELATMTERLCPGLTATGEYPAESCGVKPIEEFYTTHGNPDRICKEHRRTLQRRYDKANPEKRRDGKRLLQRVYRYAKIKYDGRPMTPEDREAELARDPLCRVSVCVRLATEVDHDHATGDYRGMLCKKHNLKIHSDTDLAELIGIIEYLGFDIM